MFDTILNRFNDGPLMQDQKSVPNSKHWVVWVATVGGLGRAPVAPGTVGTLAAVPLIPLLALGGEYFYMASVGILALIAVIVAQVYENLFGTSDPQEVVIDEVVGFAVAMTWLPLTWQSFAIGFVLFRALDAVKPFPISVLDQRVKGGLGVVADDLLAGIMTNVVLQIIYVKTSWLGVQLVL